MNNKILVPVAYFIVCFFWGLSWLAIQLSLPYFPPFFNSGLRFLIAALLLTLITIIYKFNIPRDSKSLKIYFVMGVFTFAIPFALVYWAEMHIPSSLASILFGIYPFMVAVFSAFFIKSEKLTLKKIIGIVLAFSGLVVIFSEGLNLNFDEYFWGMVAVSFSATIQALLAVYLKKNAGYLNPMTMNVIPLYIAAFILLSLGLITNGIGSIKFEIIPFLYIVLLAIFATIFTFTAYYWLLKRVSVVVLSLTSFITPIVAILFGWLLNNEQLSSRIFFGTAMILLGILVVNLNITKRFKINEK